MENAKIPLVRLGATLVLVLALGLVGCQSSSSRSFSQKWADRDVASAVEKELSKDTMFKFPNVKPVVYEGTVQLTGFAGTPEQRQRAAELAARAQGVQQVINNITLQPTPTGPAPIHTNAPGQSHTAPTPTQGAGAANQQKP